MAGEVSRTRQERLKDRGPSRLEETLGVVAGTPNTPADLRYKEEVDQEALKLRENLLAGIETEA